MCGDSVAISSTLTDDEIIEIVPCKGATSRKCAEIDNQIISIGNGLSTVITTVRDGDGVVKSVTRNVVAATADAIIQEEMVNLPANAEMTHVRQ